MDSKGLDFAGLAAALLGQGRLLIPAWLPGGSMRGHEYVCGSLRGGPGESFSVNVDKGFWADFADGSLKGGDLISLYAAIEGIKQGVAAKILAEKIGFNLSSSSPREISRAKEKTPDLVAPPAGAAPPDMRHGHFGIPSSSWCYRDKAGDPLFWIARYDQAEGRKQFTPWCWDGRGGRFVMKAWPAPRPLYGLDRLAAEPEKRVLLVEGEKAAEFARTMGGDNYVVVSWPGGAAAWRTVDWTPLHGRRLLLWPDADRHIADTLEKADKYAVKTGDVIPYEFQPGPAAMAGIAGLLHGHALEIKVVDVGIDSERPDGWDAADAVDSGWNWTNFIEWAKPLSRVFGPTEPLLDAQVIPPTAPAGEGTELEDRAPRSLYGEWERIGIATSANGSPICNVDNALRVIEGRKEFAGLVWFDEFHKRYMTRFDFNTWQPGPVREWSDVDELNLTGFMQRQLGIRRMSDDMVHKAAVIYSHQHMRNEPRDWMNKLKWDGKPRIETFFTRSFGVIDSEYAQAASKNFWIGMAARIYRPGCQLDNMVVLEGPQGIGKTKALRAIGGPWYTEAKEAVTSSDFFMVLHGRLLVEIAELDSFNRAEVTRIKQVVTCSVDRYRSPYARSAADHPRMSIFVGTTNETNYLRDHTGARRFWPIRCHEIDLALIDAEREQLYAEAVARFKKGETWHVMPAGLTAAEQEERRAVDEWENIVSVHLSERTQTSMREVADYLKIDMAKLDMVVQKRIATVLRTLGWERKQVKLAGGGTLRVWQSQDVPFKEQLNLPPAGGDVYPG